MTMQRLYFSQDEYRSRLAGVQQILKKRGVGALLSYGPENICYLTGHQTPGYYMYTLAIVPASGDPYLLVRQGELANAWTYSWLDREHILFFDDTEDPVKKTLSVLEQIGLGNEQIGMEMDGWFLSPNRFMSIKQAFSNRLLDCSKTVEELRKIKSPQEIAYIRKACECADKAIQAAYETLREGVTENDLAREMFAALINNGSEYFAIEPFVASGPRASIMHSHWIGRKIEPGDTILLEVSGSIHRYHGALMRTIYLGEPMPRAFKWSEICIRALNAAIAAIKPGATSGEVDQACRGVIEAEGLFEHFRKRTGYSIGIAFAPDWGEGHFLGLQRDDNTILKPGMVFHMPPALRDFGKLGVGFSETVLVTETGCEPLTTFRREFIGK